MAIRKVGRQKEPTPDDAEELVQLTFRADRQVLDALEQLEHASGDTDGQLSRRRSVTIRRVILEAAERLKGL